MCDSHSHSHSDSDDLIIDDKWVKQEKKYNDFYRDKPTSIKLYFIYVNNQNVVEIFKNDTYLLNQEQHTTTDAIVQKDVLLSIIKNNISLNGRNYKLVSLLKFNLDIEPEDIINWKLEKKNGSDYLSSEKEIKDIIFYDTIGIFQDINSLFFVYQDKLAINNDDNHKKTHKNIKKIYLKNASASTERKKKYTLKKM